MSTDPLDGLYGAAPETPDLVRAYIPPDPFAGSALGTLSRGLGRGAVPLAAGVAVQPIGELIGGGIGALVGGPVGGAIGAGIGGLVTAGGAGYAADKAQTWTLDRLTQGDYSRQRAADDRDHPFASFVGGALPQLAFMRPGATSWRGLAAGAAIGGGVEAGSEYAQTGEVDPLKVAASGAFGALLQHNTRLGDIAQAPAVAASTTIQRGIGQTAARIGANATLAQALREIPDADARIAQAARDAYDPNIPADARADLARFQALRAALGDRMTPDEIAAGKVIEADAVTAAARPPGVSAQAHGEALATGLVQAAAGTPIAPAMPGRSLSQDSLIRFVINDLEGGSKVVHYSAADGGTTKYGIAAADNPGVDVANLSEDQAVGIAKSRYWYPELNRADPRVAAVAFDAGYISGPKYGKQLLAEAGNDPARALAIYRAHLDHIADTVPGKAKYREGWGRRVDRLEARLGQVEDGAPRLAPAEQVAEGEPLPDDEGPSLEALLPREDHADLYQRLDDATDRVVDASDRVATAERAIRSRTTSDAVALIDPDSADIVRSHEEDRDRPGATRAQQDEASRQIGIITQSLGEDAIAKAENDFQIGLRKRLASERSSLKARRDDLSFVRRDFDMQAQRKRAEIEAARPAPAEHSFRPPADLPDEQASGFGARLSPYGGFHAVDGAGDILVPSDHVPGVAAPRFRTEPEALKAAPKMVRLRDLLPAPVASEAEAAALDRYSEPGGEGQAAQVESLSHDVELALEADPKMKVRLDDGHEDVSVAKVLERLDAEEKAIAALKACAAPGGAKT